MKQTVVIGISSGIAAYKMLDLIRNLRVKDIRVRVVMTKSAGNMISVEEIEKLTGANPLIELFPSGFDYKKVLKEREVDHIKIADSADVFLIAPATANVIAKLAHGIADDALTTTALAITAPVIVCPSMNVNMWSNPATQENLATLRNRGFTVLDPDEGALACGYTGKGRLPEIERIQEEVEKVLVRTTRLKSKKVLVTAGGTIESIDGVRAITNFSTGKMGAAIANAAYLEGAEVTFLHAKNSQPPRYQMNDVIFTTSDDLRKKIAELIMDMDVIFHTAAVADFTVQQQKGKLDSNSSHLLELKPQAKILDSLKKMNPSVRVIAFKAETNLSENALIDKAKKRLEESKADAIVANDVGKPERGFGTDTNEVWIVTNEEVTHLELQSKTALARQLLKNLF
jgi:phosphopantothenoylcysteine decarboxylase/phosphopantothenate--cysteine ligase